MNIHNLRHFLGYSGLIPFALASFFAMSDRTLFGQNPLSVIISYSAVILAFLTGALWGTGLKLIDSAVSRSMLIISNLIALLAWMSVSLNIEDYSLALGMLMFGYIVVLAVEIHCYCSSMVDRDRSYIILRTMLTSIVLTIHLILILFYGRE